MTVTPADFAYVSQLVHGRSAIVLEPGKEYLVSTRLLPLVQESGLASVGDLVTRLRAAPQGPLAGRIVEAMTTNETSWFRDAHPFTLLKDVLLPRLEQTLPAPRHVRVWSAASSTGQEAYSVAMLLLDWLATRPGWSASILATDLSEEVLERGRSGTYSTLEANRGLPAPMLARHFSRVGTRWQVSQQLRSMVEFRALNLAEDFPALPSFDIVLCRNVLIYFDDPTRHRVLEQLTRTMRGDGVLVLGAAESTLRLETSLERVHIGRATYHQLRSSGGTT